MRAVFNIACQDYLEFLASLETASVDCLITDPPYGTTNLDWDKSPDLKSFWQEVNRVCKPAAVQVVFASQPFTTDLIISNRGSFRYSVVWEKTMSTGYLDAEKRPMRGHEDIIIFCQSFADSTYNPQMKEGKPKGFIKRKDTTLHYKEHGGSVYVNDGSRYPTSVLKFSNGHGGIKKLHPTQKPLDLLLKLVLTYSNKGDVILDPFFGSGTTGHAALLTGRKFCGCEISQDYYLIAKKRMKAVLNQPELLELVGTPKHVQERVLS